MKTSRKQILENGKGKSMSSPEVFPASPSLVPDSERERKMTAISGRKCYERYGRYSPIGLLVKTLLESSRWYSQAVKLRWDVKNLCSERLTEKEHCIGRNMSSKQCVTTLNVKDIPSNRLLFRLVPSERRTGETGCGSSQNELLPTVQTQGLKRCNENGKTEFYPVKLLPTPYCGDASGGARKLAEDRKTCVQGKGYSARLNDLMKAGVLPTPAARDYQPSVSPQALKRKNGKMRTDALCNLPVMLGEHHSQNGGKTSQLNPLFVAEMMGFSPDWTVLPFQSGGRNR